MPLIECVPNVSEGRRAAVVEECAGAIRSGGASLVDVSSDPSHNRTVFTFAGEPAAVEASALALFAAALPLIDMRTHTGGHPRVGAVDVVPFVPLDGLDLARAVESARRVGAEVARRHDVPVYLYEAAATSPARRHLEAIRRGQFEGLAAKMRQSEWRPDFGPCVPHPTAGASIVGARDVLIAFNIDLESTDVHVADAIARAVRESSGGLPGVKAMGVNLPHRNCVQVSTNVTNYRIASLADVFDRVVQEAGLLGVAVRQSEIVGLVPAAAMIPGTSEHIKLGTDGTSKILEARLGAAADRPGFGA
jgi:glutamate formiminotransferase